MQLLIKKPTRVIALLGALQLAFPASAQTTGRVATAGSVAGQVSPVATPSRGHVSAVVNSELLAAFQSIASQNQCVIYAYDRNGNITSKIEQAVGASPTWGSAAFGCFIWTAP